LKRTKQIRDAILSLEFGKVLHETTKQLISNDLAKEIVEMVKNLGVLVVPHPNPSRQQMRDQFAAYLSAWLVRAGFQPEIRQIFDEVLRQASVCEPVFHAILAELETCPTGSLPGDSALWAALLGVGRDMEVIQKAISNFPQQMVGGDTAYLSSEMLRIEAFDRKGIDPDAAAEGYARHLASYLKMLGHKNGWFNNGSLTLPPHTEVPPELTSDRSPIALAAIWNQFDEQWAKVRYFSTSDVKSETGSDPDSNEDISKIVFTHDFEYFRDIEVARSRLRRQMFEISMHVIYSRLTAPVVKNLIEEDVPLAPRGFIENQEAVAMMALDICYELNLSTDKASYQGLTLAEWLRAYSLLRFCSENGICLEPIAAGVAYLDVDAFLQLAARAGLKQASAEIFLGHSVFSSKSRDLWDTPLLKDEAGRYILLTSLVRACAPSEAIVSRLNSLLQQVRSKGPKFEAEVRDRFAQLGAEVKTFKYTVDGVTYECDAAALWQNTLFLAECKANVLPQPSAEDLFFYHHKQKEATRQIERIAMHCAANPGILQTQFGELDRIETIILVVINQAPFWTDVFESDVHFYDGGALSKFLEGSINAVLRRPMQDDGILSTPQKAIHTLWGGLAPIPSDLMKQLEAPYQYEKEISMWRLSSQTAEINGTLQLQMPTLVRLPDPVPTSGKEEDVSVPSQPI
jgi:hypothetical protein